MSIISAHVTKLTVETKETLEDILDDLKTITQEIQEGERKGDTAFCEWCVEDYDTDVVE